MALVLFFDGSCGFCKESVRKIHRLDREGKIDFAPLQGELGRDLGLEKYAETGAGTMVVVSEEDDQRFYRSDAVIEIGKVLGAPWSWLSFLFGVFPKKIRDRAYDLVARNRHRFIRNPEGCDVPSESLQKRMRQ
jgi:predicted DCC family thiol-disulfide oxidoreductase YuxK